MKGQLIYVLMALFAIFGGLSLATPSQASASAVNECNNMWWIEYEQGCIQEPLWQCVHPYGSCPCGPTCDPGPS